MNILYLGPYRYDNIFGISSRDIIELLSSNENIVLTTKNIFLDNPYSNPTFVNYDRFNTFLDKNYDIIIQHSYPDMMHINKDLAKKFIAIPIFDYSLRSRDIEILKMFDAIYTDDFLSEKILKQNNIESKIFSYNIQKNNQEYLANIEYHSFNKKFYFIADYATNANMINKIIASFIFAFRSDNNISLIFILTDNNQKQVEKKINDNISDLFNRMKYAPILSPIKVIVQPLQIDDLHTIHRSFDIYIDLKDKYTPSINRHLAMIYGNKIIDSNMLQSISTPIIDIKDNDIEFKESVLTISVIQEMRKALADSTKNNFTKHPTIDKLICT